jgi:SNF2 family DNA or RNA helicase
MKRFYVVLIITILFTSNFGIAVYANSDLNSSSIDSISKEKNIKIYYINGDWQYQPESINVTTKDKYLNALNYLASGEKLPQGCFNEFPESFKIQKYEIKNNCAYIYIDKYNASKIDEIHFSIDVITDILSYNVFRFDKRIENVSILCEGDNEKSKFIKKADFFEPKIDTEQEKKIKDKVHELEEKFKGMSQEEIFEFIENNRGNDKLLITTARNYVVVIDPGHGGSDPGAVGTYNGTQYK